MSTISLNLEKGISLNLSKEFEGIKNIDVGLGWKTHMDLDAFAIMLDSNGKVLGATYYGDKDILGVKLSGDDLVGGKAGDCETLFIKTDLLSRSVKKICLFANIYRAGRHTFNDVANSYIRLVNADTKQELAKYSLKDSTRNYNAIHFADLDVTNEGLVFTTVGSGLNGSISEIKNMIADGTLYENSHSTVTENSTSSTSSTSQCANPNEGEEFPRRRSFLDKLFGR